MAPECDLQVMRVEQLGTGTPEIAIVGGIHGDEPCGVHAVETILAEDYAVDRPVKLVVANEAALAKGARYLDADLNRSFPGTPDAEAHERRLAADLAEELSGCRTLSLHSTQSYGNPFALVADVGDFEREICPALPVDAVVETTGFTEGRIFEAEPTTIEVECGFQGSQSAAEAAVDVSLAFLRATGALSDETEGSDELPVFRLRDCVPKRDADEYEVHVENFARVDRGEAFASVDGDSRVAEEPFHPVLMSAHGYESVFGYAADRVGELRHPEASLD